MLVPQPGEGPRSETVTALRRVWCLAAHAAALIAIAGCAHDHGAAAGGAPLAAGEGLLEVLRQGELAAPVVLAAFVAAAAWGAAHALTPGHGKALVAAYLVGSRSTPWHAIFLGLTVTATHTLGVFALGVVALFASRYVLPEELTPWLELVSGGIVVAMGALLLASRTRRLLAHDHGHSHLPPDAPVTWRALLGLGISGGLVPCPAALVLLLAAVSVDRTALGMALVLAFSASLAAVLTAVGLLFLKGSQLVQRLPQAAGLARFLPVASALVILAIGLWLTAGSVAHLRP